MKLAQFKHWPAVLFFLVALFIFVFVSNHTYNPNGRGMQFTHPMAFSGDEPHYVVMIYSMLSDGDLVLGNNYQSVRTGGIDAGYRFRGAQNLDHHTLIKDLRTGEVQIWENVFDVRGPVRCTPGDLSCVGFRRISAQFPDYTPVSPDYVELPKHPLPYPVLLALVLKVFRIQLRHIEAGAIYLQVLLSWLAGIITYVWALKMGLSSTSALGVVSLLFFASPWLMYSHELLPATFMGLLLVIALWAFMKKRMAVAAACVAIAAMQSEAFVLIFLAWWLLLYFSNEKRSAWRFAASGSISVALVSLINHILLGRVTLRGMNFSFDPRIWRTFAERETGLWLFIPWTIPALCFLVLPFLSGDRAHDRLLKAMAGGIFPVAAVYMILPYTGGYCYGPRYWVPYVPWLALAFILGMKTYSGTRSIVVRPLLMMLVGLSVAIGLSASVLPPPMVWQRPPVRPLGVFWQSFDGHVPIKESQ